MATPCSKIDSKPVGCTADIAKSKCNEDDKDTKCSCYFPSKGVMTCTPLTYNECIQQSDHGFCIPDQGGGSTGKKINYTQRKIYVHNNCSEDVRLIGVLPGTLDGKHNSLEIYKNECTSTSQSRPTVFPPNKGTGKCKYDRHYLTPTIPKNKTKSFIEDLYTIPTLGSSSREYKGINWDDARINDWGLGKDRIGCLPGYPCRPAAKYYPIWDRFSDTSDNIKNMEAHQSSIEFTYGADGATDDLYDVSSMLIGGCAIKSSPMENTVGYMDIDDSDKSNIKPNKGCNSKPIYNINSKVPERKKGNVLQVAHNIKDFQNKLKNEDTSDFWKILKNKNKNDQKGGCLTQDKSWTGGSNCPDITNKSEYDDYHACGWPYKYVMPDGGVYYINPMELDQKTVYNGPELRPDQKITGSKAEEVITLMRSELYECSGQQMVQTSKRTFSEKYKPDTRPNVRTFIDVRVNPGSPTDKVLSDVCSNPNVSTTQCIYNQNNILKDCINSYTFAFDDAESTSRCAPTNKPTPEYTITLCPTTSLPPKNTCPTPTVSASYHGKWSGSIGSWTYECNSDYELLKPTPTAYCNGSTTVYSKPSPSPRSCIYNICPSSPSKPKTGKWVQNKGQTYPAHPKDCKDASAWHYECLDNQKYKGRPPIAYCGKCSDYKFRQKGKIDTTNCIAADCKDATGPDLPAGFAGKWRRTQNNQNLKHIFCNSGFNPRVNEPTPYAECVHGQWIVKVTPSPNYCYRDCDGIWDQTTQCSPNCGTNRYRTLRYTIPPGRGASHGGAACPYKVGDTKKDECKPSPCPKNCPPNPPNKDNIIWKPMDPNTDENKFKATCKNDYIGPENASIASCTKTNKYSINDKYSIEPPIDASYCCPPSSPIKVDNGHWDKDHGKYTWTYSCNATYNKKNNTPYTATFEHDKCSFNYSPAQPPVGFCEKINDCPKLPSPPHINTESKLLTHWHTDMKNGKCNKATLGCPKGWKQNKSLTIEVADRQHWKIDGTNQIINNNNNIPEENYCLKDCEPLSPPNNYVKNTHTSNISKSSTKYTYECDKGYYNEKGQIYINCDKLTGKYTNLNEFNAFKCEKIGGDTTAGGGSSRKTSVSGPDNTKDFYNSPDRTDQLQEQFEQYASIHANYSTTEDLNKLITDFYKPNCALYRDIPDEVLMKNPRLMNTLADPGYVHCFSK